MGNGNPEHRRRSQDMAGWADQLLSFDDPTWADPETRARYYDQQAAKHRVLAETEPNELRAEASEQLALSARRRARALRRGDG